ncbi:hypothetical protein [Planomicrobium sp. CPCC 101110]|uniref:hypothetical protein n=1 Tax=Planomicrobium sp. CPCC 101110 TaxID=2599619 RepID=UPI0011B67B7B|nr:hypothetical protein [Planomicrobium sp. CPCC 101110]TWT26019.1 hypothetical protein FQV30_09515 [Planomicrobium sp. CPCC 101110]
MQKLHETFIHSTLTERFTLSEVKEYLINIYKAKLVSKETFEELKDDVAVNFNNIVFCFSITDEEVRNTLLTDTEKLEEQEIKQLISKQSFLSEKDKRTALHQAEGIHIILESSDGKFVDNFTLQGGSEKLLDELIFLRGIDSNGYVLGNEEYEMYLEALQKKGLL